MGATKEKVTKSEKQKELGEKSKEVADKDAKEKSEKAEKKESEAKAAERHKKELSEKAEAEEVAAKKSKKEEDAKAAESKKKEEDAKAEEKKAKKVAKQEKEKEDKAKEQTQEDKKKAEAEQKKEGLEKANKKTVEVRKKKDAADVAQKESDDKEKAGKEEITKSEVKEKAAAKKEYTAKEEAKKAKEQSEKKEQAEKATETQKKESHVKKTREQKNKEVAEKKGKESAKKERGDKELKAKGEHKKHHEAAQKASEKWNKRSTSYVLKQCWEQDKKEVNRLNKAVTDTESKLSRLNNKRDHLKKQEMALQFSMENLAKEGIAMCKSLGSDGAIDKSGASDDVRAFLKTIGRTFCQQVSRSSSLKQWIKEKAEVEKSTKEDIGEITMSKKLVTQETEYLNKRSRKCCNTRLETVKGEWAIVKKNGARRAKESQLNMEVIKQLGGDPKQLKPIKEPVTPAVLTLEERLRKSGQKVCHAESSTPKSLTDSPTRAPTR